MDRTMASLIDMTQKRIIDAVRLDPMGMGGTTYSNSNATPLTESSIKAMLEQMLVLMATMPPPPVLVRLDPAYDEIPNEGVRVGEIIGWRVWRVSRSGFLHSGHKDNRWIPGEPMEGDVRKWGVYAVKEPGRYLNKCIEDYDPFRNIWDKGPFDREIAPYCGLAVGRVRLYGTVVEHEHGYRAQYAMVDAIVSGYGGVSEDEIQCLRKRYGVE
jgi:hypothetical protein